MADRTIVRDGPFAQFIPDGVRQGNVIYLSGAVSVDAQGQVVGTGDILAQMKQAYANVNETLAKLGASMADVIDETMFVTDIGAIMGSTDDFLQVRADAYGGDPDVAQTLIGISALVMPDLMIEIKVAAIV